VHAAPPPAKFLLISSYSRKKCLAKISVGSSKIDLQFIFTADGCRICPLNLPLSAPACCWVPFRLSKYRLSNSLSKHYINQTSKQNYPSQLEKISRYPKEDEPNVFLNTYPYTNLAYNVMSAYLIHLVTRPVTKGRTSPLWRNFLLPWKNVLDILHA